MTTRTQTDERRWSNTDPSLHFNHDAPRETDWREEYIQALKDRDYDAAELIKSKQMISDECPHHSANQFRVEHPLVQSLAHVEISRDEEKERNVA